MIQSNKFWFQMPTYWKKKEEEQYQSKVPVANKPTVSPVSKPMQSKAEPLRQPMMSYNVEWTILPWVSDETALNIQNYVKSNAKTPEESKLMLSDLHQEAIKGTQVKEYQKDREKNKAEMVKMSMSAKDPEEKKQIDLSLKLSNISDIIREWAVKNGYTNVWEMWDKDVLDKFVNTNPDKQTMITDYLNWKINNVDVGKQLGLIEEEVVEQSNWVMWEIAPDEWLQLPYANPIKEYTGDESWLDYAGWTIANIPWSAWNIISWLWNMVMHPIDTAKWLWKAVSWAGANVVKWGINKATWETDEQINAKIYNEDNPVYTFMRDKIWIDLKENEQVADSMWEFLANRYGGREEIKKTFKEDPVWVVWDVVWLLEWWVNMAGKAWIISEAQKVWMLNKLSQVQPYTKVPELAVKWAVKTVEWAMTIPSAIANAPETIAKTITKTKTSQDKLFKAQNPSLNVLNKNRNFKTLRAESDLANQLIVDAWHSPIDTETRRIAHEATMKSTWAEVEKAVQNKKTLQVDQRQFANILEETVADAKKSWLVKNTADIKALEAEAKAMRTQRFIDLPSLEKKKQYINGIVNNRWDSAIGDVYKNGMKKVTRAIWEIEDATLAKIPWEFSQLKKNFGALKATYEDILKADLKAQKAKWMDLIESYSRLEGIWDIIWWTLSAFTQWKQWLSDVAKWVGKVVLWKALAKTKDADFLIKEWFKSLLPKPKTNATKVSPIYNNSKPVNSLGQTKVAPKLPVKNEAIPQNKVTVKAPEIIKDIKWDIKFKSDWSVEVNYIRNIEKSPNMWDKFLQSSEPKWQYFNISEWWNVPQWRDSWIKTFKKPLVIERKSSGKWWWKDDLSNMYWGKKWQALTDAIKKDWYDWIITYNEIRWTKYAQESVDLANKSKWIPAKK